MPFPISFESLWYFPMITFLYLVLKILIISPWSLRWEANFLFLFFCYCRNNCEWSHTISLFFFFPLTLYMGCGENTSNSSVCWRYFQIVCYMLKIMPQTHRYYLLAGAIMVSLIGDSTNLQDQLLLGDDILGMISKSHKHPFIAYLLSL